MSEELNTYEQERRAKLQKLRELGIDPFGQRTTDLCPLADVRAQHKPVFGQDGGPVFKVAGRIVLKRDMGKLSFLTIRDDTGDLQIALDRKRLDAADPKCWEVRNLLDLGDQIVVEGPLGATKTGEPTVWATSLALASKALLPPPAKWEGLTDVEARYRQRYVDLFANPDVMRLAKTRIRIVDEIRSFLKARGFEEVETPMLQLIHGGAAARPFKTHHNALDLPLFMRIAPELFLKRLLVGGMPKVFEINRNFRNEGISTRHNPEFTMLEAYEAYGSWETMADLVEEMICTVAEKVIGTLKIVHGGALERAQGPDASAQGSDASAQGSDASAQGSDASAQGSDARAQGSDARAQGSDARAQESDARAQEANARARGPEARAQGSDARAQEPDARAKESNARARGPDARVEKPDAHAPESVAMPLSSDKSMAGGKVIDLTRPWRRVSMAELVEERTGWRFDKNAIPAELLASIRAANPGKDIKQHANPAEQLVEIYEKLVEPTLINPTFVTRVPGVIIPLARRCRDDDYYADVYELAINGQEISPGYTELNDPDIQSAQFRQQVGDREEQQQVDEDFLTALKYGMPPAGGMGMGIDRLIMMLTGAESIRDVVLFPLMRPANERVMSESDE